MAMASSTCSHVCPSMCPLPTHSCMRRLAAGGRAGGCGNEIVPLLQLCDAPHASYPDRGADRDQVQQVQHGEHLGDGRRGGLSLAAGSGNNVERKVGMGTEKT